MSELPWDEVSCPEALRTHRLQLHTEATEGTARQACPTAWKPLQDKACRVGVYHREQELARKAPGWEGDVTVVTWTLSSFQD